MPDLRSLLEINRQPVCDLCGERLTWGELEMHHIFGRDNHNPAYDVEQNCVLLCRVCHKPGGLGYQKRLRLWEMQLKRGYDMQGWYAGLNLRVVEIYPSSLAYTCAR
jgi:5-methylcytosine-specific restriction endonuclease McrA